MSVVGTGMVVKVTAYADDKREKAFDNVYDVNARVFDVHVNDVLCTVVTYDAATKQYSAPRVNEGIARSELQRCVRRAVEHESLAASNAAFSSTRNARESSAVKRAESDADAMATLADKIAAAQADGKVYKLTADDDALLARAKAARDARIAAAAAA